MPRINITEVDRTGSETYEPLQNVVLMPGFKFYGYDVDNNNQLVTLDGVWERSDKLIERINEIKKLPDRYISKLEKEYQKAKGRMRIEVGTANDLKNYTISELFNDTFSITFTQKGLVNKIKLISEDSAIEDSEIDLLDVDVLEGEYVYNENDKNKVEGLQVNAETIITIKVNDHIKLFTAPEEDWMENIKRVTSDMESLNKDGVVVPLYSRDLGYVMTISLLNQGLPVQYAGLYEIEVDPSRIDSVRPIMPTEEHIQNFYKEYQDKGKYDIKFITPGALYDNVKVLHNCMECAAVRGDAIATLSLPTKGLDNTQKIENYIKENLQDFATSKPVRRTVHWADKTKTTETYGTYSALFVPNIIMNLSGIKYDGGSVDINKVIFPAYFNYLLCFAKHTVNNPDWFAIAGSIRGQSPKTFIPLIKFGDADVDILEDRSNIKNHVASNPICNIAPYGDIIWGNRTMHPLSVPSNGQGDIIQLTASSFLNIRHLCCDLKKAIYQAGRRYSFDPNSDVLWFNFKSAVKPILENMMNNQGIRSYQIIRVKTNKKAVAVARVIITPIEAVEDFDIMVELADAISTIEQA